MRRPRTHITSRSIARLGRGLVALGGLAAIVACGAPTSNPHDAPHATAATSERRAAPGVRYREVHAQLGIEIASSAAPYASASNPERIPCATCHAMLTPNPSQRGGATLARFHQDVEMAHGNLTCLSCHDSRDYQRLHLADDTPIAPNEVHRLCAQCHGQQATAYAHGAHGGMTGAWDASRGEQQRNRCTHCHAPHAPAFPSMQPTFKPRDRFLAPKAPPAHE